MGKDYDRISSEGCILSTDFGGFSRIRHRLVLVQNASSWTTLFVRFYIQEKVPENGVKSNDGNMSTFLVEYVFSLTNYYIKL